MSPILDHLLVGAIIAGALGWLSWRSLRRKSGPGCSSGCGCGTKPTVK